MFINALKFTSTANLRYGKFMTKMNERLILARKQRGYETVRAATEAFGWVYQRYYNHEQGLRGISLEAAQDYALAFGVDPVWLVFGDDRFAPKWDERQSVSRVPIAGTVAAGTWVEPNEPSGDQAFFNGTLPQGTVAYRVMGDSMDQLYQDGDMVFAAPGDLAALNNGQVIVAERVSLDGTHEYTLKEFQRLADGSIFLTPRSSNPRHTALELSNNDEGTLVRVLGRVIASQSKVK